MIAAGAADIGFEQNMCSHALRSLAIDHQPASRVVRGLAIDAPRPAIHMLLR